MIRKDEDFIDSMQYALRALYGHYNEQSGRHKRTAIIDAEYTHVCDSAPQPITDTEVIHMKAKYMSIHSVFSFEECVTLLTQKSSWDIVTFDPLTASDTAEVFYRHAPVETYDPNGSRHKWYYGLERQRRHPCPTNQKRPQKKHHT